MAKVKNVGAAQYVGVVDVAPGEVLDVTEEQAKYLCSDECPGQFERVAVEAAEPKKGKK